MLEKRGQLVISRQYSRTDAS
eukprot:COSAG02_NODE_66959_length_254_cov_0.664516_1_plen_20_part_10